MREINIWTAKVAILGLSEDERYLLDNALRLAIENVFSSSSRTKNNIDLLTSSWSTGPLNLTKDELDEAADRHYNQTGERAPEYE